MGLFEYLATPTGTELMHAVILLIAAVAAVLSAWARHGAVRNSNLLNSHLHEHVLDRLRRDRPNGPSQPHD